MRGGCGLNNEQSGEARDISRPPKLAFELVSVCTLFLSRAMLLDARLGFCSNDRGTSTWELSGVEMTGDIFGAPHGAPHRTAQSQAG